MPEEELEEPNEPLDISFPDGCRKRITYILVAPIMFPLWLTLPDTRSPKGIKWQSISY
jgi:solute carrier family 24 (sodium/potassium/calcium exchanger), member 2